MKYVIEFLQQNYRWIIYLLVSIISTVVLICVKRKKVLNEFDLILIEVMKKIPDFINQAEILKGADVKKQFVLKCIEEFVKDQFSVNLSESTLSSIDSFVEKVLSTPQKHTLKE